MDMILKNTFQSVSPAYELIGDVTVGTNTTQVDFTGLSIGKDDELLLVSDVVNANGSLNVVVSIYANGNTTATSYYAQELYADSTTVGGARANSSKILTLSPSRLSQFHMRLKLTNAGYFIAQSDNTNKVGNSAINLGSASITSTFTPTAITSLTIIAGIANAIGIGSRFQLYKLVAEKVADIIVPSNTTSVDITGLNIGKDGEYYLVSDVASSSGSTSNIRLFANNNVTATNYYHQALRAIGASVDGFRGNSADIAYVSANRKGIIISKIKLTNNGYFISQNESIRDYDNATALQLNKFYQTSTFSSPSITSLTITASVTNAIGANSRFTLYKMK